MASESADSTSHEPSLVEKLDAKLWTMRSLYQRLWLVNYKQSERRMTWWQLLHLTRQDLLLRFVVSLVIALVGLGAGVRMEVGNVLLRMEWFWHVSSILVTLVSLVLLLEVLRLGFYLFVTRRTMAEVEKDPNILVGIRGKK